MPDPADLRAIAKARVSDPMNTWPDHNTYHRRTILKNWLEDENCLRCHLEAVAAEQAKAQPPEEPKEEDSYYETCPQCGGARRYYVEGRGYVECLKCDGPGYVIRKRRPTLPPNLPVEKPHDTAATTDPDIPF